ncbi:putative UDP-arabinose 4-epimerase 1 [Hibiscus syriacus]|uniref:UDP-arabinose 4-epimerase 1 n=1 Tax=Hibiscus syriacus TaxID=106335 RepID=A0A6A3CWJ8_HIBSY|nr:putative UDP-arabinose 4-epimerase 1 [Hibiscus syriacus]
MWDLNDSPYQQPRDDESEGCCSSQKTSVDGDEDKGKRAGSMSNSSSSALVVEDGSEEEDGERIKEEKYYHNITSNTLVVLESMAAHGVRTLTYSSTCATYGEPEKMPITEETPQARCKLGFMLDNYLNFCLRPNIKGSTFINLWINIELYYKEIDLRFGTNSGACFDAARGIILGLKVKGMDYKTHDGTCIRDYIDVTDLVDAHLKALQNAKPHKVGIYNVGTGRGRSVKEFLEACKKATGVKIKVDYLPRRPGDYAEVYPTKIRQELNWIA